MRYFEEPVVEVMNFSVEDVITASGMPTFVGTCVPLGG